MFVELDVFSGRPNPGWDLTTDQQGEFLGLLQLLPTVAGGTPQDGLGYRGIVVTVPGELIDGFDQLIVSRGIVEAQGPGGRQVLLDKDRALERWLLETGKTHLDSDLFDAVSAQF